MTVVYKGAEHILCTCEAVYRQIFHNIGQAFLIPIYVGQINPKTVLIFVESLELKTCIARSVG